MRTTGEPPPPLCRRRLTLAVRSPPLTVHCCSVATGLLDQHWNRLVCKLQTLDCASIHHNAIPLSAAHCSGGGGRGRGKRLLNRGMNNGNYIGKRSEAGGAGPSTEGALQLCGGGRAACMPGRCTCRRAPQLVPCMLRRLPSSHTRALDTLWSNAAAAHEVKEDNHAAEAALGFPLHTDGPDRLGWLMNMNQVRREWVTAECMVSVHLLKCFRGQGGGVCGALMQGSSCPACLQLPGTPWLTHNAFPPPLSTRLPPAAEPEGGQGERAGAVLRQLLLHVPGAVGAGAALLAGLCSMVVAGIGQT